jgi:hypothetical protein
VNVDDWPSIKKIMEIHMRIIGFIVFFVLEILFIPLSIIGFFIIATKPKRVSRKLGVSSTAVSVIANRWMMHVFGRRADWPSVKLFAALPNSPVWGMRLVFFPTYVAYKIAGDMRGIPSKTEEGMETLKNVGIARDTWFDAMIEKSKDAVEHAQDGRREAVRTRSAGDTAAEAAVPGRGRH